MSDSNNNPHIELFFKENGRTVTARYVVSDTLLRETEDKFNAQIRNGLSWTAIQLRDWLEINDADAKLDRADGPAQVTFFEGVGSREEKWMRDGKLHREGGPAHISVGSNGAKAEFWYRDGKLDRADGPAWVQVTADGKLLSEKWFKNGDEYLPALPLSTIPGVRTIPASPQP